MSNNLLSLTKSDSGIKLWEHLGSKLFWDTLANNNNSIVCNNINFLWSLAAITHLAGAVEYTDCFSAEG